MHTQAVFFQRRHCTNFAILVQRSLTLCYCVLTRGPPPHKNTGCKCWPDADRLLVFQHVHSTKGGCETRSCIHGAKVSCNCWTLCFQMIFSPCVPSLQMVKGKNQITHSTNIIGIICDFCTNTETHIIGTHTFLTLLGGVPFFFHSFWIMNVIVI